jgi:hypothetical protein
VKFAVSCVRSQLLNAKAEDALRETSAPVITLLSEVQFASLISRKRRLKELSVSQAKEIIDLTLD